jgi:uncharacterized protein
MQMAYSGRIILCALVAALFYIFPVEGIAEEMSPEDVRSFESYKAKAEAGDAEAQFQLGGLYDNGFGVKKDLEKGWACYNKAADQGCIDALCKLAYHFQKGERVPRDYVKAAKLYRQAAEQGRISAQYEISDMYMRGNGVEKSMDEAYAWLVVASTEDFDVARAGMDSLEKRMTRGEINAGQKKGRDLIELVRENKAKRKVR